MKKVIIVVLSFLAVAGAIYLDFSSPPRINTEETRTYDTGYEKGLEEGYRRGISEALEKIEDYVTDDLFQLESDVNREYGMYPEEAAQILTNYSDDSSAISEDDLYTAIWAIRSYYYGAYDIVNDIDEYWID